MSKRKRTTPKGPATVRPRAFAVALFACALAALVLGFWTHSQAEWVDIAALVTGVTGVIAGAGVLLLGRAPSGWTRIGLSAVAFLGWALVSAFASGRGWSALVGEPTSMLGWLMLATVGLIGFAAMASAADLRRILVRYGWWFVLAETLAVAGQLLSGGTVGTGTLPNSTYFGQALLLLLPWVLVDQKGRSELETRGRQATVLAALAMLAATGSRAAVLLAVVWALWYVLTRGSLARRVRIAISAVAVAIAAAAFVREQLVSPTSSVLGMRPGFWLLSAKALWLRPLLGWGPDGFLAGGSAASTVELAQRTVLPVFQFGATDPHSLVAWVAVSTGAVGALLFLWFVFEVVRVWRRRAVAGEDVVPAIWAVSMCFVVFLTAPATLQVLPLFALVLGTSLETEATGSGRVVRLPRWASISTIIVLMVASALFAANGVTRLPFEGASAERSPALASAAQAASDLWPFDAHLAYLASLHLGYAVLAQQSIAVDQPDLLAIERAARLDSRNASYSLEKARTLSFYGAASPAIDAAFAETFDRYPFDPLARAEYGLYLARTGRYDAAEAQLKLAVLGDPIGAEERLKIVETARAVLKDAGRTE